MTPVDWIFLNVSRQHAGGRIGCGERQGIVRDVHFIQRREQWEDWEESILIEGDHAGFCDIRLFLQNCRRDRIGEGRMVELVETPPFFTLTKNFDCRPAAGEHKDGYREVGVTYRNHARLPRTSHYPQVFRKEPEDLFRQRPALFLDRDGVVNIDKGYVHKPEDIELCPGIEELVKKVKGKGWWVCVLSNQSGVGRGLYSHQQVESLHRMLGKALPVDRWFYCPSHPEGLGEYRGFSHFRKPGPGMVLRAERELPIDRMGSLMIGDKETDRIQLQGLGSWLIRGNYPLDPGGGEVFSCLDEIRERL